jgi:hypothetical protein
VRVRVIRPAPRRLQCSRSRASLPAVRFGVDRVTARGITVWNLRDVVGAERLSEAGDRVSRC